MKDIKLSGVVLEVKSGTFASESGKTIEWKTALIKIGDRVMKFKTKVDLTPYLDKLVDFKVDIFAGQGLAASLRIVDVA